MQQDKIIVKFFLYLKFFNFLNFYKRLVMQFLDFNFATTFYIRKTKDEHRIMSLVKKLRKLRTKNLISPLSYISCYFSVTCPTDFIALTLNTL